MQRLNNTDHPVNDLIAMRWSPRAFAARMVEAEDLRILLEAARWAPSSSNEQPWSFIIATKDEPVDYDRLLTCLVERNQTWARSAPVLMISVAAMHFRRNNSPNRHALYDVGQSVAYMTLQATSMHLYMHQMAGFSADTARKTLEVPPTHEPVSAIALGYLGDTQQLPEDFRQRETTPSTRYATKDFVFAGKWGQTAGWVGT